MLSLPRGAVGAARPSNAPRRSGALHVLLAVAMLLATLVGGSSLATASAQSAGTSAGTAAASQRVAAAAAKSVAACSKRGKYLARYYRGTKASGKPVKTRCEKRVDATYRKGAKPSGVNVGPNKFSVTWTRSKKFTRAKYEFRAKAKHAITIKVDGKKRAASSSPGAYVKAKRTLKGKHTIQFRYVKKAGAGYARAEFTRLPDRKAPRKPRSVSVKAGNRKVTVQWKGSDEIDLRGYRVFRNGKRIGQVSKQKLTDKGLTNGKTYKYRVQSLDRHGNTSKKTTAKKATPRDNVAPAQPKGLDAKRNDNGDIRVDWTANTDKDLAGYVVYRKVDNGKLEQVATRKKAQTSYVDKGVKAESSYTYRVAATDTSKNESKKSAPFTVDPVEDPVDEMPDAPENLEAVAGDGQVVLTWDANTEDDFDHYVVFRDGESIADDVEDARYVDTEVDNGTEYTYDVVAVDEDGNTSKHSDSVTATPVDTTAPAAPEGLKAVEGDGRVVLTWDANTEDDFDHYVVFRDGESIADDVEDARYVDTEVDNGTEYTYDVVAVDEAGNTSKHSDSVTATPVDTTAPAVPAGLEATADDAQIGLSWTANTEKDLAGYRVYRDTDEDVDVKGDPLNADLLDKPSYSDATAEQGTKYFYVVTAVDESDNESGPSDAASATVPEDVELHEKYSFTLATDMNVPQGYTKNDGSAWTDVAGLGWVTEESLDAAEHEPLDLTANTRVRTRTGVSALHNRLIHLQYGDVAEPDGKTNPTSGAFERAVPDGWYRVKVSVGDQPGGPGYDSRHTVNVEGDKAIEGFQGSAGKEYEAATVTVEVTDGRLTVDALGGTNTKLNYLELDSTGEPDQTAPEAPSGLDVEATDDHIALTWEANTEGDLAGYHVYRGESEDVDVEGDSLNGQPLTDTTFVDQTAVPGVEYFYVVTAVDESGNESDPSEAASATIPAPEEVHEKYSFTLASDTNVPQGYTKNDGSAWTDAAGLGWVTEASLDAAQHQPLDLTKNTRVRAARTGVNELQRRVIHLHYGDIQPPSDNGDKTPGAFERAVPNGWYRVKVSVGDEPGNGKTGCPAPCYDSVHQINVEGVPAVSQFQATAGDEYETATVAVEVTDGRLTVESIGGNNTKLNYLELDSTDEPQEPVLHEKVRFADEASAPPAGYLKDYGQAYGERTGADQGDGLSYGWLELGTDDPVNLVGNGRNRLAPPADAPASTPELQAGLMHMQLPENASNGVPTPGYWEMAVPDGTYQVSVSVGDAGTATDSEHWLNIEGQNAIAQFVPTGAAGSATHHASATRTVTVDDGRLTVDPESGTNTKINWVTVDSVAGASDRPSVLKTTPGNLATGLPPESTSVVADLHLVGGGVDPDSLDTDSVRLVDVEDGSAVDGSALTSGGADTINFSPSGALDPNTLYRLEITDDVEDVDGNAFLPYSMVFETGDADNDAGPIAFDQTDSGAPKGAMYTSVVKGPDGKLYAGSITGEIYRFDIEADGTLSNRQTINTVKAYSGSTASDDTYNKGTRTVIGLAFDPASTAEEPILWISDNAPFLGASTVPDFTGRIAKLTGPDLDTYTAVLEHLPRSVKDHETNSLAFGPDGALYFNQGANNAMGAPDGAWANREEQPLSAAVLRLDPKQLPSELPLDVDTRGAGAYDPYAEDAPLTVYGHGVRNAYDLVWHSNGHLYVPTNGSAAGGNVPAVPDQLPEVCSKRPDGGYTGPKVAAQSNNPDETDYVFDIKKGKYYGHPNPSRCEYVLNNGNPTAGTDPFENPKYPVGTQPDPNYALSDVYDAGSHASANGAIEYRGGAFGGALDGKLLYVRYSSGQDIATFDVAQDGRLSNRTFGRTGLTGFNQPLDVTEDVSTGNLYVTELTNNGANTRIVLVKPRGGGGGPIARATDRLVFSGPTGSTSDARDAEISNQGVEDLVVTGATLGGGDAGQFQLTGTTFPQTVGAGDSLDIPVRFKPTTVGVKTTTLTVQTNAGPKQVRLRGLAASGLGGSNEPSLQRIMDTWQIPIDVGDPNPSDATMPGDQKMIGDEVPAQLFKKAAFDAPISITPIAAYGPQDDDPAIHVGWHDAGDASDVHQEFSIAASDAQGLMIDPAGETTGIDPGEDAVFGFYSEWPYFDGRRAFTQDSLNTWDAGREHHVRVYPYKNQDGSVEPNTYVVATEEVPGANFDSQDIVLVVRNVEPYVPEAADAVLETENLDVVPFDDRLAMSRIQTPADGDQKTHDTATVRVSNTGTEDMQIGGLNVTGPFQLVNPPTTPLTVADGEHMDLTVRFTATGGAVHTGSLDITSNAGENGTPSVELAGFWQSVSEGGQEPSLAEMMDVFGYGTNIPANLNGKGLVEAVGDEVLSPYWRRSDTSEPVRVRQLAAYHTYPGGAQLKWFNQGSGDQNLTNHHSNHAQSLLPARNSGQWPATFNPAGVFGFKVDSESSDPTQNSQGPDQDNGCPGPCGHHVRFFPVKDRSGDVVKNSYLMVMDYSGINYDYNDNVYLIENIKPELLQTPRGLSALAGDGEVTLTWSPTTDEGVSYRVWRDTDPDVPADGAHLVSGEDALTEPTFTDTDVQNGQTYYYVVRAVIPNESNSASTAPVAATPNEVGAFVEKVNFQNQAAPLPSGYLKDFGQPYGARTGADQGSGLSYGWLGEDNGQPLDLSVGGTTGPGNGRDRNATSDQRLDTLMHMQADDVPNFNGTPIAGQWELAVPDGTYAVTVAVGDPNTNTDPEIHTLNVEGENAIEGFVPSGAVGSASHHKTATVQVEVDDGRLTLDAIGGTNTKINYVEVAATD